MSERRPAQNKTSATPSQATQACSPLLPRSPLTDEQSESVGSNSNISKELGGIQPKTIRRSLNWQNISVEAPSRGNGMSLPGGIQRKQEEQKETPAIEHQVSAKKAETSTGELSDLTKATEGPLQPKIDRGRLNWRNISVEAPALRGEASSQPIQRQQEEQEETPEIQAQLAADSAEKTAGESSNSTIISDGEALQPKIARAPFNGRNIPVEAPQTLSASSAYQGIQRLETSGVKEQEKSTESLQMQSEEEIQAKSSEGEPQEKEEQNQELVQTKLTVGAPGDKYEQEADSMAAKVMTMPDSAIKPSIQRQAGEDTEAVQMQPLVNSISPLVQRESGKEDEVQMKSGAKRASDGSSVASSSIESRLASSKGGGSALPDNVRRFMEPRFGADFSNIKVHTDSNAVQMNKEVGAQAFAHGGDIYFGAGKSPGNNELTAHELTHTIQQGAAGRMNKEVRRQPQQEEEQETIQAKEISISGSEKLKQVSLSNKESSFQASEPETETQAAKALSSYNTNHYLNKELRQKPQEQEQKTTQEEPIQAKQFTNSPSSSNKDTIQRQSLAVTYVSPRIQGDFLGIGNPIDKIKGAIAGLAKNLPGYSLLTLILGKDPISDAPVQRNATNLIRGLLSLVPNGDNIFNNLQQSGTLQKSFDWFNGEVAKLNLTGDAIKGLFGKALKSLGISDAFNPMGAFEKVKSVFVEPIGRIKNFAVSAGTKVMEFAFEGFLNRAGGAGAKVMGILRKAGGAFTSILKDPVAFCGNLVGAVRGGCQKFSGNAATHLKNGLTGWLFGALAGAGLTIPAQFDTKGIVSVVLQVLGATYERLRGKLANKIGEQKVGRLEKTFDFLKTIVTGGLGTAWQKISEFAGNLQEMVIGGIKEWVMQSVITSAITKLISMFNPAGAVIQAAMAIYNTVMFFIERGSQIAALAEAVFNSIGTIAAGNVAGAANYMEQTIGRSLPVMISFLARLLGLGGISEHIKNVIKKIQSPIENAMNKLANFIVEKGKNLLGKGKADDKDNKNKEDKSKNSEEGEITAADRQKHQQYAQEIEQKLKQKNHKFKDFESFHAGKQNEAENLREQYQKNLKKGIKLSIDFKAPEADKKDGDIDVKIKIAPNTTVRDIQIGGDGNQSLQDRVALMEQKYDNDYKGIKKENTEFEKYKHLETEIKQLKGRSQGEDSPELEKDIEKAEKKFIALKNILEIRKELNKISQEIGTDIVRMDAVIIYGDYKLTLKKLDGTRTEKIENKYTTISGQDKQVIKLEQRFKETEQRLLNEFEVLEIRDREVRQLEVNLDQKKDKDRPDPSHDAETKLLERIIEEISRIVTPDNQIDQSILKEARKREKEIRLKFEETHKLRKQIQDQQPKLETALHSSAYSSFEDLEGAYTALMTTVRQERRGPNTTELQQIVKPYRAANSAKNQVASAQEKLKEMGGVMIVEEREQKIHDTYRELNLEERTKLDTAMQEWEITGTININDEQAACTSCQGIIRALKSRFSNLKVNLVEVVKSYHGF